MQQTLVFENTQQSIKEKSKELMSHIQGKCSEKKAEALISLMWFMKPKVVVELGVFAGKSLLPIAFTLQQLNKGKIYGIDPWSNDRSKLTELEKKLAGEIDQQKILQDLKEHVQMLGLEEHVQLIQAEFSKKSPVEPVDVLHIDRLLSKGSSLNEIAKWVGLVRLGGAVIFDDMPWGEVGNVITWLDEKMERMLTISDEDHEWGMWIKKAELF